MKTSGHFTTISLIISTASVFFVAFYSYKLDLFTNELMRQQTNDKEAVLDIIENVYEYRTLYTIEYDKLDNISYTNYNCTDPLWEDGEILDLANQKLKLHQPCWAYDQLSKMRNDFQRKTVKARILGSTEINLALDDIESGFGEVLDYYLSNDYYMRAFPDAYLEIMPKKFDKLVDVAKSEIGSNSN